MRIRRLGQNEAFSQIEVIACEAFDYLTPQGALFGETDDTVVAPNLRELLGRSLLAGSATKLATLISEAPEVIGFSIAIPLGDMDPTRADESADTAYTYFTALRPDFRGHGLVGPLQTNLCHQLVEQGYSFMEEDVRIKNGYAANVTKHYKQADAIVRSYDHCKFPEIGFQRNVRIDLRKLPL